MTIFLLLVIGVLFLFGGAKALIRGAVALGRWFGLSPLTVGMLIVGAGTSIPELVVSVDAMVRGVPTLVVGNVIGSNISNILVILALAALLKPIGRPARLLLPDGVVLLAVSAAVVISGLQGSIPFWQGATMICLLAGLLASEYLRARRETRLRVLLEVQVPFKAEVPGRPLVSALMLLAGLGAVIYGAELFLQGSLAAARAIGVSDGLVGLTIVAIGTSIPEIASSMVASWRGHSDVAYGNIIGSNLFNLLGILGAAALAGGLEFPLVMVWLDGPVMIAATVLMLYFVSTDGRLSRREALVMLALYFVYLGLRFAYALS